MPDEAGRPRVLCVWRRYPWPLHFGDSYRRFNMVKRLQERFAFDLYCYDARDEVPRQIGPYFGKVMARPLPTEPGMGRMRTLLAGVLPYRPGSPGHRTAHEPDDLLWNGQYDLLIASLGVLPYLPRTGTTPVLGDIIDNDCVVVWRDLQRSRSPLEAASHCRRMISAALYQRAHFGALSVACYVSQLDAAVSRRIGPAVAHEAIPNGVDTAYFTPDGARTDSCILAFEGNMSFPPNADAARYLIAEIVPRVRAVVPEASLHVIGKDPQVDLAARADAHTTVTGFVEDIRPWLGRASVFVCPMREGAGIKNKILQAWAMGIPVVATSKSIGGLHVERERNIVVRDGDRAFAQAVIELLQDPERARSIGMAGRRTVEDYYSWDRLAMRFGDLLDRLLASGATRSRRRSG